MSRLSPRRFKRAAHAFTEGFANGTASYRRETAKIGPPIADEAELVIAQAGQAFDQAELALGQLGLVLLLVVLGFGLAVLYLGVKFVKWAWVN